MFKLNNLNSNCSDTDTMNFDIMYNFNFISIRDNLLMPHYIRYNIFQYSEMNYHYSKLIKI